MGSEHLILLAIYGVPFLAAAALPGWKSLGVYAVLAIALAVWVFQPRSGEGLAGAAEAALGVLVLVGMVAGIVGNLVRTGLRRAGAPAWSAWAGTFCVGLVLPVAYLVMVPNSV